MKLSFNPSDSTDVVKYRINVLVGDNTTAEKYFTLEELEPYLNEETGAFVIDINDIYDFSDFDDEAVFQVVAIDEADNISDPASTTANIDFLAPNPPSNVHLLD